MSTLSDIDPIRLIPDLAETRSILIVDDEARFRSAYRELLAAAHGLRGVFPEIQQDLLQTIAIAVNRQGALRAVGFGADAACLEEGLAVKQQQLVHQLADIKLPVRLPGIRQLAHPADDAGDPINLFAQHLQLLTDADFLGQLAIENLQIALDDAERVARLVNDASCLAVVVASGFLFGLLAQVARFAQRFEGDGSNAAEVEQPWQATNEPLVLRRTEAADHDASQLLA